MPKKRQTKRITSAKIPAGDKNGNSSDQERQKRNESIDLYLKDFDMRVENIIAQARHEAKAMCAAINHAFMMELFKMPKHIQEMTREEFLAKGGSISGTYMQHVTEITDSLASSVTSKTLATSSAESASETASGGKEENGSKATATTKKKGAKGRKKNTVATASKRSTRTKSVLTNNQEMNTQENTEPQTVRRSTRKKTTRNQLVTPAANTGRAGAIATGWDTPMVTPKFDPRLPVTPSTCAMRNVKRGETVMSLSGSPIIVPPERDLSKPEAVIPLGDGTALTIGTSSPQVDMTMDETTRKNILLLQSNLAKILKQCPVQGNG